MKRALVSGASGFLGSHVSDGLARFGWDVTRIGRPGNSRADDDLIVLDLTDQARVQTLIERRAYDLYIHLAAPASVPQSFSSPLHDFQSHVTPMANVLEAIRACAAPTSVLLVSSAAVYGEPAELPVGEESPLRPVSPYGFHKLHQELLLTEYHQLFGIPTTTARVFSTFGEGLRALAVWDITRRALSGRHTVEGSGDETRDYLHVSDIVRALLLVAEAAPFGDEKWNVASGTEVSIRNLASMIYAILGVAAEPAFTGATAPGLPRRWQADIRRIEALGFVQSVPLEQGLRQAVDWIRRNA